MSSAGQRIEDSWETNAPAWMAALQSGRIESRRLATDAAMLDSVVALAPRRVLDVGCGEGWLCRALAEKGIEALGIDACAALLAAARARGGCFRHMSYDALACDPLALGRFDAALCNFSLFHQDLQPLLRALSCLLHPHGALLVQTLPSSPGEPDGWRDEDFATLGHGFKAAMPYYRRSRQAWLDVIRAAGFASVRGRDISHPHTGAPLSLLILARR